MRENTDQKNSNTDTFHAMRINMMLESFDESSLKINNNDNNCERNKSKTN